MKFTELRCKEVICVRDGQRLGYVADVQVEVPSGCILALIVPGPCRFLGLIGRHEDYLIPWSSICRIGPDIILVDIKPESCIIRRERENRCFRCQ